MKYYWIDYADIHALWEKKPDGTRQRLYQIAKSSGGWRVVLRDGATEWKDFPYDFGSLQLAKDSINLEVVRHIL